MTVELKRHLHCLLFFAQILLKIIHLETSHRVKLKMLAFHLHYTGPCYATCVFFSIFSNLEQHLQSSFQAAAGLNNLVKPQRQNSGQKVRNHLLLLPKVTISDIPLMCCKSSMIVYFHLHFIQMEKSQNPLKMHLFVFYLSYPQTIKYDKFMSASICLQNLNLSFNACRKLLLRLLKPWFSSADSLAFQTTPLTSLFICLFPSVLVSREDKNVKMT